MRRYVLVPLVMFTILGCLQPLSSAEGLPSHDLARSRSTTITVYDSNDLAACESPPFCSADIRLASLRSFIGGTGRRMLAVTVMAYEPHAIVTEVSMKLRFDANGGPPARLVRVHGIRRIRVRRHARVLWTESLVAAIPGPRPGRVHDLLHPGERAPPDEADPIPGIVEDDPRSRGPCSRSRLGGVIVHSRFGSRGRLRSHPLPSSSSRHVPAGRSMRSLDLASTTQVHGSSHRARPRLPRATLRTASG